MKIERTKKEIQEVILRISLERFSGDIQGKLYKNRGREAFKQYPSITWLDGGGAVIDLLSDNAASKNIRVEHPYCSISIHLTDFPEDKLNKIMLHSIEGSKITLTNRKKEEKGITDRGLVIKQTKSNFYINKLRISKDYLTTYTCYADHWFKDTSLFTEVSYESGYFEGWIENMCLQYDKMKLRGMKGGDLLHHWELGCFKIKQVLQNEIKGYFFYIKYIKSMNTLIIKMKRKGIKYNCYECINCNERSEKDEYLCWSCKKDRK